MRLYNTSTLSADRIPIYLHQAELHSAVRLTRQRNVAILALTICWTISFLFQRWRTTVCRGDRWDIISKCFYGLHANSVLWSHLIRCLVFSCVKVATYAGNIIYLLCYSLAYSYTFSVACFLSGFYVPQKWDYCSCQPGLSGASVLNVTFLLSWSGR